MVRGLAYRIVRYRTIYRKDEPISRFHISYRQTLQNEIAGNISFEHQGHLTPAILVLAHVNEVWTQYYNNNTNLQDNPSQRKKRADADDAEDGDGDEEEEEDLTSASSDGAAPARVRIRFRPRAAVVVRSSTPAAGDRVPPESIVAYVIWRSQKPPARLRVQLKLITGYRTLSDRTVAGRHRRGPPEIVVEGAGCEGRGDEESQEEEEEEEERSSPCSCLHFKKNAMGLNGNGSRLVLFKANYGELY